MKYTLKVYNESEVMEYQKTFNSVKKAVKEGYSGIKGGGSFLLLPEDSVVGIYIGRPEDLDLIDMKGLVKIAVEMMEFIDEEGK